MAKNTTKEQALQQNYHPTKKSPIGCTKSIIKASNQWGKKKKEYKRCYTTFVNEEVINEFLVCPTKKYQFSKDPSLPLICHIIFALLILKHPPSNHKRKYFLIFTSQFLHWEARCLTTNINWWILSILHWSLLGSTTVTK